MTREYVHVVAVGNVPALTYGQSMGAESTPRNAFLARLRGMNDPPSSSSTGTRSSSLTWPSDPETAPTPSSSALMLSSPLTEISRIAPPDAYDSGSDVFGDRTFLPDVAPDSQARYSLEYQAARLRRYDLEADWLKNRAEAQEDTVYPRARGEGSQPLSVTGGLAWDEEMTMPSTSETEQASESLTDGPAFVTPTRPAVSRASQPREESMAGDDQTPTQARPSLSNELTIEDSMIYEDEIIPLGTLAEHVRSRSASRSQSLARGSQGPSNRSSHPSTPHSRILARHQSPGPVLSPTTPTQASAGGLQRPVSGGPPFDDLDPGVPRNAASERTSGSRFSSAASLPNHASARMFEWSMEMDDARDRESSYWEEELARVDIGVEELTMANDADLVRSYMKSLIPQREPYMLSKTKRVVRELQAPVSRRKP